METITSLQTEIDLLKDENKSIKGSLSQLLVEYADYRKECDEICKEYEETILLLSESLEKFKSENSKLNTENEKISKELEKSREKNKDKIKDIEILNNKLDQLQAQFNSINKKETTLKSKVVTLETDNDTYLNKIHQYEEEVTDLKDNLENNIENLITIQNDFDEYKAKKEEELERLKKALQEEKENVKALTNKEKLNQNSIMQGKKSKEEKKNKQVKFEENTQIKNKDDNKKEKDLYHNKGINSNKNLNRFIFVNRKIKEPEPESEEKFMCKCVRKNSRAMTIAPVSYNIEEIFSKLRKRKEELVLLNKNLKENLI